MISKCLPSFIGICFSPLISWIHNAFSPFPLPFVLVTYHNGCNRNPPQDHQIHPIRWGDLTHVETIKNKKSSHWKWLHGRVILISQFVLFSRSSAFIIFHLWFLMPYTSLHCFYYLYSVPWNKCQGYWIQKATPTCRLPSHAFAISCCRKRNDVLWHWWQLRFCALHLVSTVGPGVYQENAPTPSGWTKAYRRISGWASGRIILIIHRPHQPLCCPEPVARCPTPK